MSLDAIQNIGGVSTLSGSEAITRLNLDTISFDNNSAAAGNNVFIEKLMSVDSSIKNADSMAERYIKGENVPVHDLMISMGKAKTELQLVIDIRNKLLEVYQEVTKIQL